MNFLTKKYLKLIEISDILSNHNQLIIDEITILVNNYDEFCNRNPDICNELFDEDEKINMHDKMLLTFDYWITNYDNKIRCGISIDWKEEAEEIVAQLSQIIEQLKYPINLNKIKLSDEEPTNIVLQKISDFLKTDGYTIISLDTEGDSYSLFIIPLNKLDLLSKLSKSVRFKFFNEYENQTLQV